MAFATVGNSQQKAAKAAGFAYLFTMAAVVYVNFGIHSRLITADSAETARNILAHERLFRIGIAGDLIYCAGITVLLVALYVILEPVSRGLALLAAFWRLVWVWTWLAVTLRLFDALQLVHGPAYVHALETERLQVLARHYLGMALPYYYVGLLFGASASTVCGYLWLKSRYVPRALAAFGVISSAWCVACTFVYYIFPNFADIVNLWWFDVPMAIFDVALSFWLLFKGLHLPAIAGGS